MILPAQTETSAWAAPNGNPLITMARAVGIVAVLWLVSSQGYYSLVAALGLESGYDEAPVLFTAYYLGWAALALWLFRPLTTEPLDHSTIAREVLVMPSPVLLAQCNRDTCSKETKPIRSDAIGFTWTACAQFVVAY
ncbi:hypothetical protein [Primorskyibacter sedentarius]|nr:hypothetical protein [Primorskyibacter sedentarius]